MIESTRRVPLPVLPPRWKEICETDVRSSAGFCGAQDGGLNWLKGMVWTCALVPVG